MSSSGEDGSPTISEVEDEGKGRHGHISLDAAQEVVRDRSSDTASVSSEESDDLYAGETRKNRFPGTAKAWRSYTESERATSASLDCERANDLSIHLYNTYALKIKAHDASTVALSFPASDDIGTAEKNGPKKSFWCPEPRWSAWPLDPCDVPRLDERFGKRIDRVVDGDTFRVIQGWRPSDDLEAELLATTLKIAKETFRVWQKRQDEKFQSGAADVSQRTVFNESDKGAANIVTNATPNALADVHSGLMESYQSTTSSIHDAGAELSLLPGSAYELIIDEDHIEDLLLPKVRENLSDLDKLFKGLHSSRQVKKSNKSRQWSRGSHLRLGPNESLQDQKTDLKFRDHPIDAKSTKLTQDSLHRDQKSDKFPRPRAIKPRDWTEVLDVAAFVGWDADVLKRTADRCMALFGTDHDISVILDRDTTSKGREERKLAVVPSSNGQDFREITQGPQGNITLRRWSHCPYEYCRRYGRPWDQPFRWREHMKRTHKYSQAQVKALEQQLQQEFGGANHVM